MTSLKQQLIDLLHARRAPSSAAFKPRTLAHPLRDWKIILALSALLLALIGTWALFDFIAAPSDVGDAQVVTERALPLDTKTLEEVLAKLDARAALHKGAADTRSGIVDPGR